MQKQEISIYDIEYNKLEAFIIDTSEPKYRVDQIWKGLYKNLFQEADDFSVLPKFLRHKLFNKFQLKTIKEASRIVSGDGNTIKYLYLLQDNNPIETVLMRANNRNTVCISTQSGCSMNCSFCATGQMGFNRNLTTGEIVQQVVTVVRHLKNNDQNLTNIVFMGMGEPFNNYKSTMAAIDILNNHSGLNFGERRMTVSTIGIVPKIIQFADLHRQVNLAISLHAANDELRSSLLPINREFPIRSLLDACIYYVNQINRRITFEWTLIDGINDTLNHAKELVELVSELLCHVNLIPLNPTKNFHQKGSKPQNAQAFKKYILDNRIPCTLRYRQGIDIQAGCGQLAQESNTLSEG